MAACLFTHQKDWNVDIPTVEDCDGVTIYKINVRVGVVSWYVKHRYKEFAQLHVKLVNDHGISKDILPPKKIINNREPNFVEKRRSDLETYLTNVMSLLLLRLPEPLAYFLDLHKFDIIVLLQHFAKEISPYHLQVSYNRHEFTILQIHAISERLKLPCPPSDMIGFQHDFSIILDFCSNLQEISICGGKSIFGCSNIDKSNLAFELSPFKSLKKLTLKNIDPANLVKAEELRNDLEILAVINCGLKYICDILLCDILHKNTKSETLGNQCNWLKVKDADFSDNELGIVDDALTLLPQVEILNLSSNRIQSITKMDGIKNLMRLNLSRNIIKSIEDLNLCFNTLVSIDLSQNKISSFKGLDKAVNLQAFIIASNNVSDLNELNYLVELPKLEYIVLTGNPISTVVDYRVKILEKFGERASRICLDNEQPTQQELDTVAVLRAIRFVKEGKNTKTSIFAS